MIIEYCKFTISCGFYSYYYEFMGGENWCGICSKMFQMGQIWIFMVGWIKYKGGYEKLKFEGILSVRKKYGKG